MRASTEEIKALYDQPNGDPSSTYVELCEAHLDVQGDTWRTMTVLQCGEIRMVGAHSLRKIMALQSGESTTIRGGHCVRMLGTLKAGARPPESGRDPLLDELRSIRALLERIADHIAPEDASC